jgi:hypothetical protein
MVETKTLQEPIQQIDAKIAASRHWRARTLARCGI